MVPGETLTRESTPPLCSRYPRHRKLISINKMNTGRENPEFNLRHDWNSLLSDKPDLLFKRVSSEFYPPADGFPLYLSMFEKELGLRVRYGVDIGKVRARRSDTGRSYILTDQNASDYTCRWVVSDRGRREKKEAPLLLAKMHLVPTLPSLCQGSPGCHRVVGPADRRLCWLRPR